MDFINDYRWLDKVVLIVEDDSSNYQYINALLRESGLTLIHAKTGEEAVNICQTINKLDLILMDIQLPFMSGYEATEKIKSFRKDLPIIALTAYFFNDDKTKSLNFGCNNFISKPIDTEELHSAISKYLDS